jgi:two-component system alkaline phosphatase synthesis response regulator PhoP/two-component system response regulator VicR
MFLSSLRLTEISETVLYFHCPNRETKRKEMLTTMAKTVLAVDDERAIVRLIQVNLERQGYTVVTASDGREALEKIAAEKPDLVVLDVMMPYLDGFEVLATLRKNPDTLDLPVIMLTAKAQDADVFRGWSQGVDAYLTKPFNPHELISFVKRILDGGTSPSSA